MKIDKIYVACCKADFYLTKICVASIRYWNNSIPVYLLKDHSQGDFNTTELERAFNVFILPMKYQQLGAYGKLYPFIEEKGSRILVIDSDIVWIRNIILELEAFSEDIIIQCNVPADPEKEMNQWYFNTVNLNKHYNQYRYPGFLFNTGQFVCNTSSFSKEDFEETITWKEKASPLFKNTFLCEDQGILNYAVAKKIEGGSVTYRHHNLFIWGYDPAINEIDIKQNNIPDHFPSLIHWFGNKTGLIAGLPGSKILKFYDAFYYSKIDNGRIKKNIAGLYRVIKHPIAYFKTIIKKIID
jgi:hypothetical protein